MAENYSPDPTPELNTQMDSSPPTTPQSADSHGAGNFPSVQALRPMPLAPPPALPREGGCSLAQDPHHPRPRPAQAPPPGRQRGDGTTGSPSLPGCRPSPGVPGAQGSLWSRNRLCFVAVYSWACRTLGADGLGSLSTGLSLLPLQALLRTKSRGYRLRREVHTHSPASLAWPRSHRGHRQARDVQSGRACGHTWGCHVVRSPAQVCQASPTPAHMLWTGASQPWMPSTAGGPRVRVQEGHRGQAGAKSSTRVPREQALREPRGSRPPGSWGPLGTGQGTDCAGGSVVLGQGSLTSFTLPQAPNTRPMCQLCPSWGGSELGEAEVAAGALQGCPPTWRSAPARFPEDTLFSR